MRLLWRNVMMPLDSYSDHMCEIVHELSRAEVDAETGPMFRVRFADGHERDAFADELTILKERSMNDTVVLAVAKQTGHTYSTVRALALMNPMVTFVDFVRICEQVGHR